MSEHSRNDDKARARFHEVIDALAACDTSQARRAALIDMGFTYHDEGDDPDIAAEKKAIPVTERQRRLVGYFDDKQAAPSLSLVTDFLAEKALDEPYFALWRRYFRAGNQRLKALLLLSLSDEPTDPERLNDLGFFNIFSPCLTTLCEACIFRAMPITDSDACRSLIPIDADH